MESNQTNFEFIFIEFFKYFLPFPINRIANFQIELNEFRTNSNLTPPLRITALNRIDVKSEPRENSFISTLCNDVEEPFSWLFSTLVPRDVYELIWDIKIEGRRHKKRFFDDSSIWIHQQAVKLQGVWNVLTGYKSHKFRSKE